MAGFPRSAGRLLVVAAVDADDSVACGSDFVASAVRSDIVSDREPV